MLSKVVGIKSDARHPREHGNPITSLRVLFVLFHRWPRFSNKTCTALVHVFAVSRLYATSPHGTVRVFHSEIPAVSRIPGGSLKLEPCDAYPIPYLRHLLKNVLRGRFRRRAARALFPEAVRRASRSSCSSESVDVPSPPLADNPSPSVILRDTLLTVDAEDVAIVVLPWILAN